MSYNLLLNINRERVKKKEIKMYLKFFHVGIWKRSIRKDNIEVTRPQ